MSEFLFVVSSKGECTHKSHSVIQLNIYYSRKTRNTGEKKATDLLVKVKVTLKFMYISTRHTLAKKGKLTTALETLDNYV